MENADNQEWLTAKDVADRLGVSRPMITKLVQRQELAAMRIGRLLRFRPEEIERFIRANTTAVVNTSDEGDPDG